MHVFALKCSPVLTPRKLSWLGQNLFTSLYRSRYKIKHDSETIFEKVKKKILLKFSSFELKCVT